MSSPQDQFITRPVQEIFGQQAEYGFAGLGVSAAIGNFTQRVVEISLPRGLLGLLDWTRTYNSLSTTAGALGPGWTAAFSSSLAATQRGLLHHTAGPVTFTDDDGRVLTFTPNPAGGYTRPQDLNADLTQNADGTFTLTFNYGAVWTFDATGRLTGRAREGQNVTFGYDASSRLTQATHSSGRYLSLSYDADGELTQVETSDGRVVAYAYASDGTLATATDPAGAVTRYQVSSGAAGQPGQVTQITDPDGNALVTCAYDASTRRVSSQTFPTGGGARFSYGASGATTVTTSPSGAVMTYEADSSGRLVKLTDPAGNVATFGYDASGYLSNATSPGGTQLAQSHDARGNLLTTTFGGATTTYVYDAQDRVTSMTDPAGAVTSYEYSESSQIAVQMTGPAGGISHVATANGLVTSITDEDGNTTGYSYDASGNLTSLIDPLGETSRFSYDTAGNRTGVVTPSGGSAQYAYDADGRVTSSTDTGGAVTSYAYSAAGQLLEITDPLGGVTRYTYDGAGHVASETDPLGRVTQRVYDADGNLITFTDPSGAVTSYEYDIQDRLTGMTYPVGAVTSYGYDPDGNLITQQDPSGTTHTTYDERGNPVSFTDATGGTARFAYDAADRQTSMTDMDARVWLTAYDGRGAEISQTNPLGGVYRQAWTPAGRLAGFTDPLGRETTYTRNQAGQVTAATDPQGGVTRYSYDPDGRRISVTTPAGLTTRFGYDASGRVITTTDPRGWITRYEYDSRGDRTAVISPSGAITRFRYDSARQLTEMTDPNDGVTGYGYDNAGRLIMVTDAKGGVIRYGYDAAGQLTTATDQLGQTTTREYDASGNLVSITDPSGHVQHMTYDADRRLTSKSAENATEVTFAYDAAGRRTVMTDATGTTRYAYDAAGRLTTVTEPDGTVLTAGYDAAGQRTSLTYPDGLALSYGYDLNGRLTSLTDSRAGQAVYALDADGQLLTEQLPGRLARRYHYEGGLLHRFLAIRDGHPIATLTFDRDPDGRIIARRDTGRLREFRYDRAGQLVSVTERDREELHFVYDAVGNRATERLGRAETHYRYDAASQLEAAERESRRVTYRYDSSGRLIEEVDGERRRTVSYDGFGLPATVTRTEPGTSERIQKVFNGDGLLSSLTLTAGHDRDRPGRRGGEHEVGEEEQASVRYLWSSDQIPQILTQLASPRLDDAERDRPGRLTADFAYGYGRTFASWADGAAVFHMDAFGSTLRTEDTEPWAQADGYQAFGAPEPGGEQRDVQRPELPRFGYRGELALRDMIYLRARSYDSALGRLTTRDPVTPPPGSLRLANPYAYAGNDPLDLTDPSGQQFGILSDIVHGGEHLGHDIVHADESAAHGTEDLFAGFAHEAGRLGADLGTDLGNWLGRDLGGWLGRDLGNDIVHGVDYTGHEIVHFLDTGRHDAAVILKDVKGALATVAVLILKRLLGRYLGPSGVGLDNNVLVYGLIDGQLALLDGKINRRHPVTSPQATLEFIMGHSPLTLYRFMQPRRGRIGSQVTETEWKAVQNRSMTTLNQFGKPLRLTDADAKVVASTMKDKIPIITNDTRMINFLQAIRYPVEPWNK
jgi:RHS repeat-associated protein